MSRIPVPSNYTSPPGQARLGVQFPERSSSPVPVQRHVSTVSMSSSAISAGGSVNDTRKRQNKKDEAIRKKIESELSRKRTISTTGTNHLRKKTKSAAKGTVAALKPSPALTVPESITVADASQLCAAKRTDCVLVVDDEEGLSGIFTAKDLAFRVTAEGLDPRNTPVSAIMTRNPMVTRDSTSATEALQLMVQRGFRHLPVCNEDGNVVGLLDITKVFHEALDKVERGSSASQKLYAALEGVQSEMGGSLGANPQAAAMLAYVDALRDKTALPDLTTVMDSRTQPATVGPRSTVRDAAKLMKECKTTAVCVMEPGLGGAPAKIAGIFTSKDVVLRVIAAGLDPGGCSVVRVMTPHPDVAPPTMTVQDALKKMHVGRYLNLPVVEGDGRLVAIVDVLKLTYATLEQMNSIATEHVPEGDTGEGPLWSRFFDSFGAQDEHDSALSGSNARTDADSIRHRPFQSPGLFRSNHSEGIRPDDSASVVDEENSVLGERSRNPVSVIGQNVPLPVDDGTYVFKFRTPSGHTHRFQARNDNVENLRDIVAGKLESDPIFAIDPVVGHSRPDPADFSLAYTDNDGDTVVMTSDTDVTHAVSLARVAGADRVVLFVRGGKGWFEAGSGESEKKATAAAEAAARDVKEVEKAEQAAVADTPAVLAPPAKVHVPPSALGKAEDVFGIPRDMVLPASLGFLGAAIVIVFVVSRFSRSSSY